MRIVNSGCQGCQLDMDALNSGKGLSSSSIASRSNSILQGEKEKGFWSVSNWLTWEKEKKGRLGS
jgi:hypothetical protein